VDWREALGWVATTGSVALFVIGFGSQAYHNWKRHSTAGLHPIMVHLSPLSILPWTIWGLAYELWPAVVTNTIGMIFSLIILVQYYTLPRK